VLRPELIELLRKPAITDDKYSRGVVGFVTGSEAYAGAAILGVTAAMRCGIGMVRYIGPARVGDLVLEVRPETVLTDGRAQAWVLGSGMTAGDDTDQIRSHFESAEIAVVDAGGLALVDFASRPKRTVLTPHAGEMAALLTSLGHETSRTQVEAEPNKFAKLAAELTDCVVLLKGNTSVLVSPENEMLEMRDLSPALSTAGTGDVLAGMLGALLAANFHAVIESQETFMRTIELAVMLHSEAAQLASEDGPVVALDVAEAVRKVIASYE
jgi:hydroxyethylthiazole kinase-like uncharacterized protein yjeF